MSEILHSQILGLTHRQCSAHFCYPFKMKVVQIVFLCGEQPLVQAIPAGLAALRYEEAIRYELQPELDSFVCVP